MKTRPAYRPSAHQPLRSLALIALLSAGAATADTTVSVGIDYATGDYGGSENTDTLSIPVGIKYETGAWTLRASLPYVRAEGIYNRDQAVVLDDNGKPDDNGGGAGAGGATEKRTESGIGDLTVGAYYTLINNPNGYGLDLGGKAKLATADKKKTLITSGENDYSIQADVYRSLPNVALFATLGYTIKGEPSGVSYKNPLYTSLGFSMPLPSGHTAGAAWDYRQKITSGGDPVSELSAFYSIKLAANNKLQLYLVKGLSDGSPEFGGGAVLSHRY